MENNATQKSYFLPVLHSHLPFVKHPGEHYFIEEHWLFEAICESYIPLLMALKKLEEKGINFKITVSMTPPLCEALSDEYLKRRFKERLDKSIELCEKEVERTKDEAAFCDITRFYLDRFLSIRTFFEGFLDFDVLSGYRHFSDVGRMEIITSAATHAFLPFIASNKKCVEAQIKIAISSHKKHFGAEPHGIWLPECAYYDGLDEILAENKIKYFFMDSHGLIYATPTPRYGVFAPIYTTKGVAAFGRDPESSKRVWSAAEGYPGDGDYRDFYRDIGYDLDFEYIKPYICPDGARIFTGLKYHRITAVSKHKEPYDRAKAMSKAREHAKSFFADRVEQTRYANGFMDRASVVVSTYDAELFGHWWFEGVEFLAALFELIDASDTLSSVTPSEYLALHSSNQVVEPNPSSWGDNGYYDMWLNSSNDWIYRHLHFMGQKMCELADKYENEKDDLTLRALTQSARELLLAQSSDWAFLTSAKTAVEYSAKRTREHISNFIRLADMIDCEEISEKFVSELEGRNSIFRNLDFRIYAS